MSDKQSDGIVTRRECDREHADVNRRLDGLVHSTERIEQKLWGGLVLLILQLLGVVGLLAARLLGT